MQTTLKQRFRSFQEFCRDFDRYGMWSSPIFILLVIKVVLYIGVLVGFLVALNNGTLPTTAAAANPIAQQPDGFLQGLGHGVCIVFAFVSSFFRDDASLFSLHNNGFAYNSGFFMGVLVWFGVHSTSNKATK